MSTAGDRDRIWTIPNAICGLRILGVLPLLWAGYHGHRQWVLWIMLALLLSDWVDGKLAILLDQRSAFGARLDSVADAIMYVGIGVCLWWLEAEAIRGHLGWFLAVAASWGLSAVVGLLRLGHLPSYHTRGAKISWLVAGVVAAYLLLTRDPAPLRWGLGLVILTNLEGTAIGLVLPEWHADVPTVFHAWRVRRREGEGTDR